MNEKMKIKEIEKISVYKEREKTERKRERKSVRKRERERTKRRNKPWKRDKDDGIKKGGKMKE